MNQDLIYKHMSRDQFMCQYACMNRDAIRMKEEEKDFRPPFFRDIDRIIYSLSYNRYIDKTQVFSKSSNDNISKRMIHVQLVSKIARTIGRALNLNEDLIEAIALGHDIGHTPFGHVGEAILNKISLQNGEGYFNHNIHSVRTLMELENEGLGYNITLQVLDGIMCHNGLLPQGKYCPKNKTIDNFYNEYNDSYINNNIKQYVPMTLEGCIVRISDIIGYIGRDIEDAVRMGIIDLDCIPKHITDILGTTNHDIVNTVVNDIIKNSLNKPYIMLSDDVYQAIVSLKKFNTENIYSKANSKKQLQMYNKQFHKLFNILLNDLKNDNRKSDIYTIFLNNMDKKYINNNTNERKVIDYIAGMTDDFFIAQYQKYCEN